MFFVVLSTVPEAMPANYEFAWHRLIFFGDCFYTVAVEVKT